MASAAPVFHFQHATVETMYIKVVVSAGSKKELVKKVSADHFEISVKEKPVQNLANRRVVAIVAELFTVPTGKVRILNGHHSPSKLLSVDK